MKELKAVIKEKPACLTDKRVLQGCLMDSGWDQRTVSVLVNLMDGGIVQKIQKNGGGLTQTDIYDLISQQERRYGTSRKFVEEGIRLWTEALGATVPKASSEVKPEQKKGRAEPSVKSAVKTDTPPAEKVQPEKRQRSGFEKFVLAVGWGCLLSWLWLFFFGISNGSTGIISAVILATIYFLMQHRLWNKGFQRLFRNDAVNNLYQQFNFVIYFFSFFVLVGVTILMLAVLTESPNDDSLPFILWFIINSLYHGLWHYGHRPSKKELENMTFRM